MMQNRRRTHVESLYRMQDEIESSEFLNFDETTLKMKMEFFEKAYKDFTLEHQTYVSYLTSNDFEKHNKFFADVEAVYQSTLIVMRKRLYELEALSYAMHCGVIDAPVQKTQQPTSERKETTVASTVIRPSSTDLRAKLKVKAKKERKELWYSNRNISKRLTCHNCGRNHKIFECVSFLKRSINERITRVHQLKLCRNCFSPLHGKKHKCASGPCERCDVGARHNSLLCKAELKKKMNK